MANDSNAQMPQDVNSYPMQVLTPDDTSGVAVGTVGATTSRITLVGLSATRLNIVEISSLTDAHVKFGGAAVDATTSDRAFPKGAAVYQIEADQTHLAIILAAGATTAKLTVTVLT